MLYHFNNVDSKENDLLSSSIRNVEFGPIKFYSNSNTISNEHKRKFTISFSERFESLKITNQTIREIVFPRKSTIILLVYVLVFVSYLYFGALCFKSIELNQEIADRSSFFQNRLQFMNSFNCVTDRALETFIAKVQFLNSRGVSSLGNASTLYYNWDITNGVFFVTSLVTTIGYGNDKPVTVSGKIFCIIYVIFGIPMMMILTSAVIERLFLLVDLLFSALFYKLRWRITEDKFREIQIVSSFLILTVCFFLIPALAFYKMEQPKWTVLDSLYFCVISLTTIGLGDLVPGDGTDLERRNLSRILATVYLFTGLLATSFCIRAFHLHEKWNLGDKLIYLNHKTYPTQEYSISSNSTLSVVDAQDQLRSFPADTAALMVNRRRRVRCNSFS